MTATTIALSGTRHSDALERTALALLVGFVASLQISIALAGTLLALTALAWIALLIRDRTAPAAPRFFIWLAAYAAVTLLASALSLDPRASLIDCKQLALFAIVPMVYDLARGSRAATLLDVIISVGAASAAYGIVQYGILHYDNLCRRPDGALTHYMTYSGILMLVVCAAAARLLFATHNRTWPALVMPALAVALTLTLGRSAWVGTFIGVGLLLALKDIRLTALLPIAIALVFALAPYTVTNRVKSMFDMQDLTLQDRLAMLEIGVGIVKDHPLLGVGPNMVPRVYAEYRPAYAVNASNPHLHNVPLQIAAERGVPALAIWLWFAIGLALHLYTLFRQQRERALPAVGLVAVVAMVAAGLFEYNFGDSEFLMTFLVLVTLPFAAIREAAATELTP